MGKIPEKKRAELSRLIRSSRESLGWSQEELAEKALEALWLLDRNASGMHHTDEEIEIWKGIEIGRHHIRGLENCPSSPLGTTEKRGRLFAVARVLGLSFNQINKVSGGV